MVERFGRLFSDLPLQVIGPESPFMKNFEWVKCSFTGSDYSKVYKLHLQMLVDEVPGIWYHQPKSQVLLSRLVAKIHRHAWNEEISEL